jgi:hypothetical protein
MTSGSSARMTLGRESMETRLLTYAELGQVLGITVDSAKRLARRRGWRKQPGNDGRARVAVPVERLVPRDIPTDDRRDDREDLPADDPADSPGDGREDRGARSLLERLEAEIAEWRTKASDRDFLAGQLEGLRLVLEEVRRERDAVSGDRDAWRRQAERLAAPPVTVPSVAPRRPWWRRLTG